MNEKIFAIKVRQLALNYPKSEKIVKNQHFFGSWGGGGLGSKLTNSKLTNLFLPVDRSRDTRTAAECIFRSKNCGSRFREGKISNKNPQNCKIF
jgi:hypothetical protein